MTKPKTIRKKSPVTKAFEELGRIDKRHEAKKITLGEHNKLSKAVLKKLVKDDD